MFSRNLFINRMHALLLAVIAALEYCSEAALGWLQRHFARAFSFLYVYVDLVSLHYPIVPLVP